ncbi:leucyl/phenylalanyl-tRNA--protein transferase [Ornithinimicrobium faecis]|uniref:Leucyl/phenylalanyl-tRNA--protein transferase n=1 Tax=Ornithinimicrobium faecis TaxID=2934158 RepID=A0ABY4YY10_9MICO|nr:leucyl/phenylalanyl-tRNA--protein transferase [Ornithinimicrobium sp. HY1793]USQ81652.1 leucyl/phenylalanyl-tRNA--protein transferase [Ornithinimicrobium sp. HY1793]
MPIEPAPTQWHLDLGQAKTGEDLVGVGADLEPGTLLAAYRSGIFPMGLGLRGGGTLGWWSPDPRGILRPRDVRVSRSLRKSHARFDFSVDSAFDQVVAACAAPDRDGRWITPEIARAYAELHRLGWAHSVETWRDGELVGGLYGVAIGGLFAGESMFHRATDASKAALVHLVSLVSDTHGLIDVQWRTEHLASLGITEVRRTAYLELLSQALTEPLPSAFAGQPR